MIEKFIAKSDMVKTSDVAAFLGLSEVRTRVLLAELVKEGRIKANGKSRARYYSST